jgi:para-nitrobenzyl esterase
MRSSVLKAHTALGLGITMILFLLWVPVSAQETVTIDSGTLRGVAADGVIAFKGVPFAAPPVGDLRWRPPQPAPHWNRTRSAAEYGHDCMQLPFPSDAAPLGTKPDEDCLVLNVWRPQAQTDHKLPVMVWIYGGGWVNGGSSPSVYDGTQFAKGGVVFVSFNYRLGRFGFFAFPALTKEDPNGLQGNYGYMDQIAALKWVQRNIEAFGGDPSQVTIFGESAGGFAVNTLLNTPLTDGLFERAIIESGGGRGGGPGGSSYLSEAVNGKPSAESIGVAFAKSKGIDGDGPDALAKLRSLPAEEIVNGLNMASMFQQASTYSGPMIDGKIVTENLTASYLAGKQHRVPVIVGANSMDIGFTMARTEKELFAPFGANATKAEAVYDPQHTANLRVVGQKVAGDAMMIEPARFIAQTLSSDGQPVWEYRFSYVADSMRTQWPGAPHASEIPYVFDTVKDRYGAALTPADEQAAKVMNAYWLQFAKTGNPNGAGLPHWPAYHTQSDKLMDFTDHGPVSEPDSWKARLDLTEHLAATSSTSASSHR